MTIPCYSVAKGRSTPGMAEITNLFGDVWREATANRDKWGCEFYNFDFKPNFVVKPTENSLSPRKDIYPYRYG